MSSASLDFQGAVRSGGLVIYPRFERPAHWIVLPLALDIGMRPDGTPDFHLDLVRSRDAGPAGYGVVDFRAVPVIALEAARAAVQGGSVAPGSFSGGWLRLMVRDPGASESSTLLPPQRVAANGLGVVRLAAQLTQSGISLLKGALLGGSVLVEAWAEMEFEGVAPRIPAEVSMRAADLAAAMRADLRNGLVKRSDVVRALAAPGVLNGVPSAVDRVEAAEAVADRLRNLRGTGAPSPERDFAEWWRLDWGTGDIQFRWDLSQPADAVRTAVLRFDPVDLVRKAASAGGVSALISERDLPDFQTGYLPLLVTANLVDVRTPVLSCGVDIEAAAKPPNRLNAIRETVEFTPPGDRQEIVIRFAANEPPDYQYQTFVIAQTELGIAEWRPPQRAHSGGELRLGVDDFAARFVPVSASPQMLAIGPVTVTARWGDSSQSVTLASGHPADALVYNASGQDVQLECRLGSPGGQLRTAVPIQQAAAMELGVFREYGSHTVEIEIDFEGAPDIVALEVATEDRTDHATATLLFTSAKPKRSWTWFAQSPLAPGFCYRLFQNEPGSRPWSAPQSPFQNLRLAARDLAGAPVPAHNG